MIKLSIVLSLAVALVCAALVAAPVVFGVLAAGGISLAMLVSIYQIVRSDRLESRMAPTVRRASATVDGVPVRDVEVQSC